MPAGRPLLTLDDLPEGWHDIALELYKNGASDVEVRVALRRDGYSVMSDDLWYRFLGQEEEFSRTIKAGQAMARAWWEAKGRTELDSQTFSPTLWHMNMANRYGWHNRQDLKITGDVKIGSSDLANRIREDETAIEITTELLKRIGTSGGQPGMAGVTGEPQTVDISPTPGTDQPEINTDSAGDV
jgi:hypothetical protein